MLSFKQHVQLDEGNPLARLAKHAEEGPAQVFERQIHEYRQPLIEYIDKYA